MPPGPSATACTLSHASPRGGSSVANSSWSPRVGGQRPAGDLATRRPTSGRRRRAGCRGTATVQRTSIIGSPPAGASAQAATRSRHHATRSGGAASRSSSVGVDGHATRPAARRPPARAARRRRRRRAGRPCPARRRGRATGRAAASATPAEMPTLVSSADDTTAGSPQASTTASAARTPPSGATLTTMTSAASRSRTRSGSSALRMDSSAAIGTSMPLRAKAIRRSRSSSTVAHGCSAYSRSWRGEACPAPASASSTDHAPLASTRTRADGPMTSRTAATRARSSVERLAALGHLDLGRRAPGEPRQHLRDLLGAHRGHRRVDGHRATHGIGPADPRRLDGRGQPPRRLGRRVLEERPELAPAARTLEQRDLARGHAAERHPHRDGDDAQRGEQVTDGGQRHTATVGVGAPGPSWRRPGGRRGRHGAGVRARSWSDRSRIITSRCRNRRTSRSALPSGTTDGCVSNIHSGLP